MKTEHLDFLITNRACAEVLEWAKTQSDLYDLWNNCNRGGWLLWLANRLKVDRKKQMLCGALCAHTVVHLMTDRRSREAVRIAFLYARGKATDKQLQEAWEAAAEAAAEAADNETARAAVSAVWAASSVWASDVWAAEAAAEAAAAAKKRNEQRTGEIARKILTQEVFEKIAEL